MIDSKQIQTIIQQYLTESNREDIFLTEVKVSKTNVVTVVLDADFGLKVEDCINISRFIESKMDRDKEDFELTVTSFGLDEYFTMPRQFRKNISRQIEVINHDKERVEGTLTEVDETSILITTKKNPDGISIAFNDIEKARVIIKF